MELYSAALTMEEMGHKDKYQLYFASERDAEDYLKGLPEESYTIEREWVNCKEFLFDYNQAIEMNVRNMLLKKHERKREAHEPKLWLVGDENRTPVVCSNWAEVQGIIRNLDEGEHRVHIKPISVAELVVWFNAVSKD